MRTLSLLPILLVAACSSEDRRSAPPQPARLPPLVHATQQDLAKELDEADRLGTWSEVKHRWQGQVLRWEVTRVPQLCKSADECHVVAFPVMRPAQRGWLPAVQWAPGQFSALEKACAGTEQCKITIEGTLSELYASPELPTHLTFSNVTITKRV